MGHFVVVPLVGTEQDSQHVTVTLLASWFPAGSEACAEARGHGPAPSGAQARAVRRSRELGFETCCDPQGSDLCLPAAVASCTQNCTSPL